MLNGYPKHSYLYLLLDNRSIFEIFQNNDKTINPEVLIGSSLFVLATVKTLANIKHEGGITPIRIPAVFLPANHRTTDRYISKYTHVAQRAT